jgi:hypothetical protein
MTRRIGEALVALAVAVGSASGQDYGDFDLHLNLNIASAEASIELLRGLAGSPRRIAEMPGSLVALSTTSTLAQRDLTLSDLERALESAKFNQSLGDDVFRLGEAKANVSAMETLLLELRRRNFAQRVITTVAQLFPAGVRVRTTVPVYVVAFGYQNVDAYVRRVVWKGNSPTFVGEGEGEVTIIVNLSKAISYGRTTDERFIGLLTVVAHEVFHAAFGVFKDGSPVWREYYASHQSYFDQLIDLCQNEGVAYYLTMIQQTGGKFSPEAERNIRASFEAFNRNAEELLDPRIDRRRAWDIIRLSNSSGFWNNYGAIAGMVVARQIDQSRGRAALSETLVSGPGAFFGLYADLMQQDGSLPPLSPKVLQALGRRQ